MATEEDRQEERDRLGVDPSAPRTELEEENPLESPKEEEEPLELPAYPLDEPRPEQP